MAIALMSSAVTQIREYLPFVSNVAIEPLKPNFKCVINHSLIQIRTISSAALTLIGLTGLVWAFPAVAALVITVGNGSSFPIAALAATIASILTDHFEEKRANAEADTYAITHYVNSEDDKIPIEITQRFCKSTKAFQQLLRQLQEKDPGSDAMKMIYTKKDIAGNTLASLLVLTKQNNPLVFDQFVEKSDAEDLLTTTLQAMKVTDFPNKLETLKSILRLKRTALENLPKLKQANIWKLVIIEDVIQILCEHDFDINAKDEEGLTFLIYWIKKEGFFYNDLIKAALKAGADPTVNNEYASTIIQEEMANLRSDQENGNERRKAFAQCQLTLATQLTKILQKATEEWRKTHQPRNG